MSYQLENKEMRWTKRGPTKNTRIGFNNDAVDIVMDEVSIFLALNGGDIVVVDRQTIKIEKTIVTRLSRIQMIRISSILVFAGDLRNDRFGIGMEEHQFHSLYCFFRFYNPGSPSVCVYHRKKGHLVTTISFKAGLSINHLITGWPPLLLVSHSSYSDRETSLTSYLSVYSLEIMV